MAKSNFIVRGGADFSGIQNEINKTKKNLKGFASDVDSIFSGISQGLGLNLGKLTKVGLIAAATKKLVDFGKQAIEVASDLTEVQNVVDVTFGSMAADINEFASTATKQFGLSELSAKQFASTMGAMLKSSGISGEAVKDMSIELTKLTADMSSFYNLKPDEAFQKIRAGISGETEPLKQLGINMSVANMQAYALSQGIKKQWKEMTQAEQTLLRYNYLLSVTGDAQGDFARNAGSWANQIKLLKEQWQEFMSLIGKALIEILLPIVKFLNRALELLIDIAKAIGSIYTMIMGKEVIAEANIKIGDSASDAADSELDLAGGIEEASKAAKKALAPFDEINQLQDSLASGGGRIDFGGFSNFKSEINTKQVDDGLEESKKRWEGFFIKINDWWNKIKETLTIPIQIPAPIFASIPSPIYEPNWGLELPDLKKPEFPPIPNPIYKPNWNLIPPPVPIIEIPPINAEEYSLSLEKLKLKTAESFNNLLENAGITLKLLSNNIGIHYEWLRETTAGLLLELQTNVATAMEQMSTNISIVLETIEVNYETHKENVRAITTAISTVLVGNINQGLYTMGQNINTAINTVQANLETFGKNVGTIAAEIAQSWAKNLNEGFNVVSQNFSAFANTLGENLKAFGEGFLKVAAETARGFVNNMVEGFRTVWDNFKELMSSLGEQVSGWFKANKSMVLKTTIAAGVIVGAGALALALPTAIPYVTGALGGLAAIPGLAEGGITNGPMLAMIGDNPGGKEVISPLDKLQDMLISAVGTAMIQYEQFSSNREPIIVKVVLEGREIAQAIYDPLQEEERRRGTPIIQSL